VKTSWIAGLALAATAVPINPFPFHQSHKLGQLIERGANTQTATANTTSMTTGDDSFDVASTSNLAVYFGRAQNNNYPSLYDLCINSNTNIVVMGFINQFNDGSLPSFAFLRTCKTPAIMTPTTSVSCPTLAQDIAFCQQQGKKVLLSLGGSSSNLTLHSTEEAKQAAQTLWDVFGMGSNVHRPFGSVVVDGFDFGTFHVYLITLASLIFLTSEQIWRPVRTQHTLTC
jgi:hypothetical protein